MISSFQFMLKKALSEEPGYLRWLVVSTLSTGLAPLVNVYVPKLILDELLGGKDVRKLILHVSILAGVNLLFGVLRNLSKSRMVARTIRIYQTISNGLSLKSLRLSYQDSEKKSTLDLMERAKFGMYSVYDMDTHLTGIFSALITIMGSFVMIISHDWRLILVVLIINLLTLPCFRRVKALEEDNAQRGVPENRAFIYFGSMAMDYRWAKDLRLYKGTSLMLTKARQVMDRILTINHTYFTKNGLWNGLARVLIEGQTAVVFLLLGLSIAAGQLTAGAFSMLYGACRQFGEAMNSMLETVTQVMASDVNLKPLVDFMSLDENPQSEYQRDEAPANDVQKALDLAKAGLIDIQVNNVSFHYPNDDKLVLDRLTLQIHSGQTLALVGRNGAGKSTLVKLLCRLYEPTSGQIALNGVDIRRIPLSEYMPLLSPTFQDYRLLPFRLSENLSGKPSEQINEQEKSTMQKAMNQVGMASWLDSQELGLDSYLTRILDEHGLVPSDGQEQKLALARAVNRNGKFLIMDEPTAALDPRSEVEIFENMLSLTRGQTAMYISHRLSSTRYANRILVMDKGQISQDGSHAQLMAKEGLYKTMFQTQAAQYQIEVVDSSAAGKKSQSQG